MAKWSKYNLFIKDKDGYTLLFNTRTSSLLKLDQERLNQVYKPTTLSPGFINILLHEGFLLGDNDDELELILKSNENAKSNNERFSATIELTQACIFKCLYCYQEHHPKHMKKDVCDKVILFLAKKMKEVRHIHVNWFGGEPLIQFSTLEYMSKTLKSDSKEIGCSFSQFLTSNGYMITPDIALELNSLGIENVQITLDGDESAHNKLRMLSTGKGTYKRVLMGCKNVIDAGIELLVRVNLNKMNVIGIEKLLEDLLQNGISPDNSIIHITRAVNHGNCSPEHSYIFYTVKEFSIELIKILHLMSKHGFSLPNLNPIAYNCPFDLSNTIMVGVDGSLHFCSSSNECIATINKKGDAITFSDIYKKTKERNPIDDEKCKECTYLPICMGGCAFLQELGQEKCIPERYILPELVKLHVITQKYI